MTSILCVCGARPNFMKVAPIVKVLRRRPDVAFRLVHTGQHYGEQMSRVFFDELGLPAPDVNLGAGSGTHARQTAEIMTRFEPVCQEFGPDWVVVVGDVNSTLACTLVAVKLGFPVAHVEAGLRSFDRNMPEEINRILTDAVAELLFVTEPSSVENLRREGIPDSRISFVGNVMIDTLLRFRDRAERSVIRERLAVARGEYVLATVHRPCNVDDGQRFAAIIDALAAIARDMPVVFPIHPRSRSMLSRLGLDGRIDGARRVLVIDPVGYLDFVKLMAEAALVLTDSGGVQEETTILNVPCLTLRDNTERPVTITHGTNRIVGTQTDVILEAYRKTLASPPHPAQPPPLWDGRAAERIVERLLGRYTKSLSAGPLAPAVAAGV